MREINISRKNINFNIGTEDNGLFDILFHNSSEALFFLTSNDLSILECNKRAIDLFQGSSINDIKGLQLYDLFGSHLLDLSKRKILDDIRQGLEYTQELTFKTLNNSLFWAKVSLKQVFINGNEPFVFMRLNKALDNVQITEILNTIIKNTAKVTGYEFFKVLTEFLSKTFEVKYSFIAEIEEKNTAETIEFWATDKHCKKMQFELNNSPFKNVLNGYTTFYPQKLRELFPKCTLLEKLNAESFLGAPVYSKNGKINAMLVLMDKKSMNDDNNVRNILSILAARTEAEMERIKNEEKLYHRTEDLVKFNKTKDKFLKIIAHDFAGPFGTIMGYAELLRKRLPKLSKDKIESIVDNIDHSIRAGFHLLQNLADWSKLQRNVLLFLPENIDLSEVVAKSIKPLIIDAQRKNLTIRNKVTKGVEIFADNHILQSIIRNLVSNSIKFSDKKGEITIESESDKEYMCVKVIDKGIGVAKKDLKKVFKFGSKSVNVNSHEVGGSGLGLALCKEFMKLHNGKIEIDTILHEGTILKCYFPKS